jgi:hypothetical protein
MTISSTNRPDGLEWLATVDVRQLDSLRWRGLRWMFPTFVDDIELTRYLKGLLAHSDIHAVTIKPHTDELGRPSTHEFDIYRLGPPEAQ